MASGEYHVQMYVSGENKYVCKAMETLKEAELFILRRDKDQFIRIAGEELGKARLESINNSEYQRRQGKKLKDTQEELKAAQMILQEQVYRAGLLEEENRRLREALDALSRPEKHRKHEEKKEETAVQTEQVQAPVRGRVAKKCPRMRPAISERALTKPEFRDAVTEQVLEQFNAGAAEIEVDLYAAQKRADEIRAKREEAEKQAQKEAEEFFEFSFENADTQFDDEFIGY